MNRTSIEWTTFTANPVKYRDTDGRVVWGCVHASPGCVNCYAEALAKRYGRGGPFTAPKMAGLTPFLDDDETRKMRTAKTISGTPVAGARCFIGDMTDIFGPWVPDDLLNRLFSDVLEARTDVTWQLLTKRAERMCQYLSWRWGEGRVPSRHIHVGVSAEDQERADERVSWLLKAPAAVRFLSAEPLLGPIDLTRWLPCLTIGGVELETWLDWVIVGGESGPGSRPMEVKWAQSLVRQCRGAEVACFVKQLGAVVHDRNDAGFEGDPEDRWTPNTRYRELTAQGWQGDPVRVYLTDRKGGEPREWPDELRIRQWPKH